MADEEHLRVLKQGPEAWNAWRRKAGDKISIDLSEANLSEAHLAARLAAGGIKVSHVTVARLMREMPP
jgi:hypothetical protein